MRPAATCPSAVTDSHKGPFARTVSPPSKGQRKASAASASPSAKPASHASVQSSGRARVSRNPLGSAALAARSETFTASALRAIDCGRSSARKWMPAVSPSTVRTRSCPGAGRRQAASSFKPRPPLPAMGAKNRAISSSSEGR